MVLALFSGYDQETLDGIKESRWKDIPLHRSFVAEFQSFLSEKFVEKGFLLYSRFKQSKGE